MSPSKDGARRMHARLKRRLERLEDRSGTDSNKPRKTQRIVVRSLDCNPSLENAECSRTLCPNGTLIEVVHLGHSSEGPEELSEEALDKFVESFPVRPWYEDDRQTTAQA